MRKIIICTFLTLDGVMQTPGGPDEDAESGFQHGGRQRPVDDEVGAAVAAGYERSDAMLLGRETYEIFASYWPTADPDNPFTSRRRRAAPWSVSTGRPANPATTAAGGIEHP